MQNLLKSVVGELTIRPELRDALRAEIAGASDAAPTLADIADRARVPTLDSAVREILRLHPPVSFVFGRATVDRQIQSGSGTFVVQKGELLMGVIPFAQRDPHRFPNPDQFDLERYDDPAVSAGLIWPRGPHDGTVKPQDRTCPGKEVGTLFGKLFCVALSKFAWELRERPDWNHHKFELNAAAPKGLLEVESFRKAPISSTEGGIATAA
jgi:cytochrome P450